MIIALTALIGGITCILYGQQIAGTIVSGVGLAGLVSQFLRSPSETEDKDKPEEKNDKTNPSPK